MDRDCKLAVNLGILNKAKQRTDIHMHTYTDTDIVIGVALSLATVETSSGVRPEEAVYSQNRDGYGV